MLRKVGHTDDEVELQKLRRGNHRCKEAAKPKVRPHRRNHSLRHRGPDSNHHKRIFHQFFNGRERRPG